jgi:hypothetical protein
MWMSKPCMCTSRNVAVLSGRKLCVDVKTLPNAFLGKSQSLLDGRLNDLQSCDVSSHSTVLNF